MQIKRILAAVLCGGLLAGCSVPALPGKTVTPATVEVAPEPVPATLTAYADPLLAPALQAYADETGTRLTLTDTPAEAALVLTQAPTVGVFAGLNGDALMEAAVKRAGLGGEDSPMDLLPLGKSLYGYWVDAAVLKALLGDDTAAVSLQNASWQEWSDFAETLTDWLENPEETKVTLNRTEYSLPGEKPEVVTADGVFGEVISRAPGYTAALLAAGPVRNADTLKGPLNAVYSAVTLEYDNAAPEGGRGIFTRGQLTEMLSVYGASAAQSLILIPFKCELVDEDLTGDEYNLTGLTNYPVLADVGWMSVSATADEAEVKAAKSAILWLYSSGEGEAVLTETLTLVTPWNTASDKSVLGAMQVTQAATGILPGVTLDRDAIAALSEAEQALRDAPRNTAQRVAYREAALAVLATE